MFIIESQSQLQLKKDVGNLLTLQNCNKPENPFQTADSIQAYLFQYNPSLSECIKVDPNLPESTREQGAREGRVDLYF